MTDIILKNFRVNPVEENNVPIVSELTKSFLERHNLTLIDTIAVTRGSIIYLVEDVHRKILKVTNYINSREVEMQRKCVEFAPEIYLFEEINHHHYILMERIDCTLEDIFNELSDLSPEDIKSLTEFYIKTLTQFLTCLERKKICHDDLHLGNIGIVRTEQRIKTVLLDFGKAVEKNNTRKELLNVLRYSILDTNKKTSYLKDIRLGQSLHKAIIDLYNSRFKRWKLPYEISEKEILTRYSRIK